MNDNGKEEWYFESHDEKFEAHPIDSHVFWTTQLIACGFWLFFAVLKILGFNIFYSCLTIISFMLSSVNLYGYYKCSRGKIIIDNDYNRILGQNKLINIFWR